MPLPSAAHLLVQAIDFHDRGGWLLDSQFDVQMGAPYLLAHGLGVPVAAIATAAAAALCLKYDVTPRQLCNNHLDELRRLAGDLTDSARESADIELPVTSEVTPSRSSGGVCYRTHSGTNARRADMSKAWLPPYRENTSQPRPTAARRHP